MIFEELFLNVLLSPKYIPPYQMPPESTKLAILPGRFIENSFCWGTCTFVRLLIPYSEETAF